MLTMKRTGNSWKIGLAQLSITMGDKDANVAAVYAMLDEAVLNACDVVAFPECCLAGWLSPAASACGELIPGSFSRQLSAFASTHHISIAIGLEEQTKGGSLYNSAVLIDASGTIRLHHRKINELEIAQELYSKGTSLNVIEFGKRNVGLSICADSWRPEVTDALWLMGARVIFSPSAWAVEPGGESTNLAWICETYRQRTADRDLYIVAPNGVGAVTEGPWKGRRLQGNSLVIGPGGKPLLIGPTNESALLCFCLPV